MKTDILIKKLNVTRFAAGLMGVVLKILNIANRAP